MKFGARAPQPRLHASQPTSPRNIPSHTPQPLADMPSFDEPEDRDDIEMSKTGLLTEEAKSKDNGPPVKKGLRSNVVDGACIILNIASTVVLVFLNKWCVPSAIIAMDSAMGLLSNYSLTLNR